MSGLVDTNILLYAVNASSQCHEKAQSFLMEIISGDAEFYLTESIVYEFMRVSTHARVLKKPLTAQQSLGFITHLMESQRFTLLTATPRHFQILSLLLRENPRVSGNLLFDTRNVVFMREHGLRTIFTADGDYRRFHGIDVINPLGESF